MYHFSFIVAVCLLFPVLAVGLFADGCLQLPPRNSTSTILSLHPNDIKIVMAMGDSVTTGFGIINANESRGFSFSMGGEYGAVTLPNLFMFFTPSLAGYSVGSYSSEVCYGSNCPAVRFTPIQDANNAAKSGAMVSDMVSLQINYLIRQVNKSPIMDVRSDWKVLSIMIGANDLCASCTFNLTYLSADDYENNLMGTLERIRASIPRTFVNLVSGFNISQAYDLSLIAPQCSNITRSLYIQCDCLFDPAAGAVRALIDARMTEFNARAAKVAAYYQRKGYDNFAVVVQPFATNTHISELPTDFLSDLDCFHPSMSGHAALAVALWNNMLTPAASKKTTLDMADTPICPTQDSLLYTY